MPLRKVDWCNNTLASGSGVDLWHIAYIYFTVHMSTSTHTPTHTHIIIIITFFVTLFFSMGYHECVLRYVCGWMCVSVEKFDFKFQISIYEFSLFLVSGSCRIVKTALFSTEKEKTNGKFESLVIAKLSWFPMQFNMTHQCTTPKTQGDTKYIFFKILHSSKFISFNFGK